MEPDVEALAEPVDRPSRETKPVQTRLVTPDPEIRTRVISRRKDFEELFEGSFTELKAVSYVVSPTLLAEFARERGFQRTELILGESFAGDLKRDLSDRGVAATRELVDQMQSGALKILVPDRTIHSKFYILRRADLVRVIASSANLTREAQRATRQVNYAWYMDLAPDAKQLKKFEADYAKHADECTVFLGDLATLLAEADPHRSEEIVKAWLTEEGAVDETRKVTIDIVEQAIDTALESPDRPILMMELPASVSAKKAVERYLGPLPSSGATTTGLDVREALRHLNQVVGLPHLRIEPSRVVAVIDGRPTVRTSGLPDPALVNDALENIEQYCHTVDLGQCRDPTMVKTCFMEVILYTMTSPFLHQYMTARRSTYGAVDMRGPRLLYVFGTSRNGKSTLLRFALKLIAGTQVMPLAGNDFKKTRIAGALGTGTVFPLAFDDVNLASVPNVEKIIKSYWEVWWRPDNPTPQIIVTTNNPRMREWAQSRMKRVDLLVHFPPALEHKAELSKLFSFDNRIFEWFSKLYLEAPLGKVGDDELARARDVMLALYAHAGRPVPDFFPREPIEKLYDPGREQWWDLVHGLKKAELRKSGGRLLITIAEDVPDWEVQAYQTHLPPHVNATKTGRTITIENPEAFHDWMNGGPRRPAWWQFWK